MYYTKESVILTVKTQKNQTTTKIVIAVRLYYIYNESFQQEEYSVFNNFWTNNSVYKKWRYTQFTKTKTPVFARPSVYQNGKYLYIIDLPKF